MHASGSTSGLAGGQHLHSRIPRHELLVSETSRAEFDQRPARGGLEVGPQKGACLRSYVASETINITESDDVRSSSLTIGSESEPEWLVRCPAQIGLS